MSWIILVPFISFAVNILLLAAVARIWLGTVVGRIFAGFLLATALWALFSWMMHADVPPSPLFWMRMEVALPAFGMTSMVYLSTQLPRPKRRTGPIVLTWFAWGTVIIILDVAGLLVKEVQAVPNSGGLVTIQFGQWMPVVWAYVLATIVGSAILYLHSYFKRPIKEERDYLRYPIVGTFVIFSAVLLNAVPGMSGYPFDLMANLMFSLIVAYGVVRHQFLTPGIIIRRSVIYLVAALTLNGIYVAGIAFIQSYNAHIGNVELWLLLVPASLLLIIAFQPMRKLFQGWVDRAFLGQQYGYERALHEISSTTAAILNMEELARAIVKAVAQAFQCRRAAILVLNSDQSAMEVKAVSGEHSQDVQDVRLPHTYPGLAWLERKNAPVSRRDADVMLDSPGLGGVNSHDLDKLEYEWLVPLVYRRRLVGILTLGAKLGQRPYSADDIAIVSAVSNQMAVNIENARLYGDLEKAYTELRSTQDTLVRSERSRAVGEVASGVAHDLNNVLTAVMSRAEMAMEKSRDPRVARDLEVALKAAQDGAAIVRRLQGFIKPPRSESKAIDIHQVIKDAVSMTEHRISARREREGIFIDIALKLGEVSRVNGEAADLRQALVNILFNAVDAMPQGGRLEIGAEERNGWLAITVRDTGVGISTEIKENLFKPFFTTKGDLGTGLGLSVAQIAIAKFEGKIDVESEPGKGATFSIRIPVVAAPMDVPPATSLEPPARVGSVLVIEDEREVRESVRIALAGQGHRVSLAATGVEGLALFQAGQFDAVVCDWGLPDMTGGDVCVSIQNIRPGTPVVLTTGWNLEFDQAERQVMGVVDVLHKPFAGEYLCQVVRKVLGSRGAAGPRASGTAVSVAAPKPGAGHG